MIKPSSKFCPYCSNSKAVDGSYQDIGSFVVMVKWERTSPGDKTSFFECEECGNKEEIQNEQTRRIVCYLFLL